MRFLTLPTPTLSYDDPSIQTLTFTTSLRFMPCTCPVRALYMPWTSFYSPISK